MVDENINIILKELDYMIAVEKMFSGIPYEDKIKDLKYIIDKWESEFNKSREQQIQDICRDEGEF
jgi:hypothetical protein